MSASPAQEIVTAAVIVIGDEILSGRTKDKNIGFLADYMTAIGIDLREVRIVPDELPRIVEAINVLRLRCDYVFTTGGIGPTHDDVTADAVAAAFEAPVVEDERILAMMKERYAEGELTPGRRRMARVPKGADLIDNPVSGLPGFHIGNVFVMAGVPSVMQAMFDGLAPRLATGRKMLSKTIEAHRPEGIVATPLGEIQDAHPGTAIGSYPYFDGEIFSTRIVIRARDADLLEEAAADVEKMLEGLAKNDKTS
ncbi:molybdenum cofactor synthesis domain-containing protein [Rhodobium orientis]|uniref:Competence/damage-inducible protein A n=1 Tax=Rhodobium orientis TaxID=34017 RepID=A0A327JNZ3_9HYPH|nr:molybdopterin-binding protein [Rhodobium orientis]MBB4301710.1 molybdenum cofactor synthesis domain-containing protein [Rhodobium orientis]MBK5950513.1 competence/damage-inducible protein A [Rhodobium orientis]RAI28159.1 competence/damage-inducible protein A [Rhodobium orientis]